MGRIAVEKLLERGDSVTVFSRGNFRPDWWDRIEHLQGDRSVRGDFAAKLKGRTFDAVIDTQAYRFEDVQSAVETFQGAVGRYLFVSTGSVYLDGKLDFATHCPFKESDVSWEELDYSYPEGDDPYGVGKRHCEKWLNENSTIPYTIVRIPAVMGWDDPTTRMWWWVQRALDGGPAVVPAEHRAMFRTLYSADAAEAFIRAVTSDDAVDKTYHIAMQEIMTIERWAGLIWNAAGHDSSIAFVPQEVISRHGTLREHSAPLSRPIPYIRDLSRAERDFGFTTTPVEDWVQTTVDWYREHPPGEDSNGYQHRSAEITLAATWNEKLARLVAE